MQTLLNQQKFWKTEAHQINARQNWKAGGWILRWVLALTLVLRVRENQLARGWVAEWRSGWVGESWNSFLIDMWDGWWKGVAFAPLLSASHCAVSVVLRHSVSVSCPHCNSTLPLSSRLAIIADDFCPCSPSGKYWNNWLVWVSSACSCIHVCVCVCGALGEKLVKYFMK